ncbi:HNH endonuclease [Planctomycetota bacterium]
MVTCFVAYEYESKVHFAPSRFIGYQENSISKHQKNKSKDGRVTNTTIVDILKETPQVDGQLEFRYKQFCQELGFTPHKTGTYGVARKFWFSQEKTDLLNEILNSSTNDKELLEDLKDVETQKDIDSTEKQRLVSARVGQGWFREKLISLWRGCAVTKCNEITILRASHIKPWRYSNNQERLDVYNGLLLTPNLDLLFDRGFISFKENGKIIISKEIKNENMMILGVNANMKITTHSNHIPYLEWHRKNIYRI